MTASRAEESRASRDTLPSITAVVLKGIALLIGAVLIVAGTGVVSAFASWRLAPLSASVGDDAAAGIANGMDRLAMVSVDVGTTVDVQLDLELDSDDPVLEDSAQRALLESPFLILSATGNVELDSAGGFVDLRPTAITTTTTSDSAVLSLRLVSDELDPATGPYILRYTAPFSSEAHVVLHTSDEWLVTSALPRTLIEEQTDSSATSVRLPSNSIDQEVQFGFSASSVLAGDWRQASGTGHSVDATGAAALFWTFFAWAGFYLWLLRDRRGRSAIRGYVPTAWKDLGPLIGALALFSLARLLGEVGNWLASWQRSVPTDRVPTDAEELMLLLGRGAPPVAIFTLAFAWAWSLIFRRRQARVASRWWAIGIALACAATTATILLVLLATPLEWDIGSSTSSPSLSRAVFVAAVGSLVIGAGLVIKTMSGRYAVTGAFATVVLGMAFAGLSSVYRIEWVGVATHVLVVFVVVFALCALVNAVACSIGSADRVVRLWSMLATAAIVAVTTGPRVFAAYDSVGLSEASSLLYLFVDPILIALSTLLVVGATRVRPELPAWTYRALFFIAAVFFFRFSTFAAIPLSLVIGCVLLRTVLLRRDATSRWFLRSEPALASSVRDFIRDVGRRRMDRDFADGLRKKVAKGDVPSDDLDKTKEAIARVHYEPVAMNSAAMNAGGIPGGALRRAAFGAAVATVAGAPFALDSISYILGVADDANGPFVLVALLGALLGLRFPLYGFAFGFLFPALRGNRGLTKALVAAMVLVITEAIVLLIPFAWDASLQSTLLLRVVQLLTVFLALGFAFDLRSLKSAGLGLDRVGDVYSVNRLVVWSSGLLVAAAAAFATSLLDTAAGSLLALITGR